jgi:hypothetical protein
MRSIVVWLAAVLLTGMAASTCAQEPLAAEPAPIPRYEVEIIVFANRSFDPTEERFEQALDGLRNYAGDTLREAPVFDETTFPPPEPQAAPLPIDPAAAERAEALRVRPLRPEELKLGSEYRRLAAIPAYQPLLHAGWVQPGLPEADSEEFDLGVLGVLNPRGTVRVHLSRFLHITLDLTYQADGLATPAFGTSDGLDEVSLAPRYRMKTTRSARSGELHYFDHPAFGVLVRVTPVSVTDDGTRRPAA